MRFLALLLCPALFTSVAAAQTCDLTADINTDSHPLSSWPGGCEGDTPVEVGGSFYFRAWTKATGMELWRTDGTAGGTVLVSDIVPGPMSSDPRDMIEHAGVLYFTAEDAIAGRELWRSDGTSSGTTRLKDIGPGAADGEIGELTSMGAQLYFVADDGIAGLEIWSTDGTSGGTFLTTDAFPGPGTLEPEELTAGPTGALLFFSAEVPGLGRELAAFDPLVMAAGLVKDISPGSLGSNPTGLRVFGSSLLFSAAGPGTGAELFTSDGTTAGTQLLKDIYTGGLSSSPDLSDAVELGGELYFKALGLGTGFELWKTDGTAAGTVLAADVNPGIQSSDPSDLVVMNGEVYFAATGAPGIFRELWASSGTLASLRLVKDIAQGPSSDPVDLVVSGGQIFFQAGSGGQDLEPWVSDGTTAGTLLLADLMPGTDSSTPTGFVALPGGKALFAAESAVGVELMISDGTPAGTVLASDVEPGLGTDSSTPTELTAVAGQELYFSAYTSDVGSEPRRWSAAGGVQLIGEVEPGVSSSFSTAAGFTEVWLGDHPLVFFRGLEPSTGEELWATDGTASGTQLVKEINPGINQGFLDGFLPALNLLFFTAFTDNVGWGVWVSDGTEAGTIELANNGFQGRPGDLVTLGESVMFSFTDPSGDIGLWTTDGTPGGTHLLVEINTVGSSAPKLMTRIGDKVVFTAQTGFSSSQRDLYITDGTAAGTKSLFPIGTSPDVLASTGFVEMGGDGYFFDSFPTLDLWRIDPVLETATFVTTASTSSFLVQTSELTATHNQLFFSTPSRDPFGNDIGSELFVSDGTALGTHLVIDLAPGAMGSHPIELVPANNGVYFTLDQFQQGSATDPAVEVYFSDGTASGTYQVCTRPAGVDPKEPTTPLSSTPTFLTLAGGNLFWSGNDANGVGYELFYIQQPGAHTIVLEPSGSHQRISSNDPILGTTLTVNGSFASPTDLSVLVMSAPISTPDTTLAAFGSASWIDLTSFSALAATRSASWTYSTALPSTPSLAGQQFTLQSWTLKSPALFPAETSNGLTIVLGN